jgi:hypothetical protein
MKAVDRSELLELGAYEQIREPFRARILAMKKPRYVALGPNITALFENHDTVLFQIQEMLRTERITAEKAILHELETYNELVPGERELSATIFIEFPDRDERERQLRALVGLEDKFFVEVGGERFANVPDRRGTESAQTMAVHYVKFPLSEAAANSIKAGGAPLKLGVDHPAYRALVELAPATVASLRDDFG